MSGLSAMLRCAVLVAAAGFTTPAGAFDAPEYLPGRIVVKLRDAVTEPADIVVSRGATFRSVTVDGSESLDQLNRESGVHRVRRMLGAGRDVPSDQLGAGVLARRRATALQRADAARRRHRGSAGRRWRPPDLTHVYVFELDPEVDVQQVAARYAADPHVEWAHPDYVMRAVAEPLPALPVIPDDPFVEDPSNPGHWREGSWGLVLPDLWGVRRIRALEAWNLLPDPIGDAGEGVLVAVIDSGVDYLHPDVAANAWTNAGEVAGNGVDDDGNGFVDDVRGYDFTTTSGGCSTAKARDADPIDDHGHGTHVTGTIAAIADNGRGIVGIAPAAKILAVKGLDDEGCAPTSDLAAAIVYAADNGAAVMNFSWGSLSFGPSLGEALDYAHGVGAVMVAAAGNERSDLADQPFYPALSEQVITVPAADPGDQLAFFSNHGQRMDVAAPGGGFETPPPDFKPHWNVLSVRAAAATYDAAATVGGEYLRLAGTSMAAPHVTGVAALVRARRPALTNEDVRQVLHVSADDVGPAGFDPQTGYGIVDAEQALAVASVPTVRIDSPEIHAWLKRDTPISITGSAGGPGFASYEVLVGIGNPPGPPSPVAPPSTVPVAGGALASWDARDASAYPDGRYALVLRVTDTGGRTFESRRTIRLLRASAADALPGWPVVDADLQQGVHNVAAGDIGLGPGNEVISAGFGLLQAWSTRAEPLFTVPVPQAPGVVDPHPPTLADLNGDGELEIVVGSEAGLVIVDDGVARVIGTDRQTWTPVIVDDLDGNGVPRIVSMDVDRSVWVRDAIGGTLPGWPVSLGPLAYPWGDGESMATGDLDGDGTKEIVVATEYTLWALNRDGTVRWVYPTGRTSFLEPLREGDLVLGDVDGDARLEVVFFGIGRFANGRALSFVTVVDGEGRREAEWTVPPEDLDTGQSPPELSLGDLDRDGDLEILLPAWHLDDLSLWIYAWHHRGQPVAGFPLRIFEQVGGLMLADVSNDGGGDLVSSLHRGRASNRIYAWSAAGQPLAGWPRPIASLTPSSQRTLLLPTTNLLDLDGNGTLDLVAALGNTEVHAIDLGVAPGALEWPVFRHDVARTARFGANPCGNGVLDPGEQCDDGNRRPCDGCSGTCHPDAIVPCGDGIVAPQCGEECDDGNLESGDCCDAACHHDIAGTVCQPDANECTIDACDGAGLCAHTQIRQCIASTLIESTRLKLRGGVGDSRRSAVFISSKRGNPPQIAPPAPDDLLNPNYGGAMVRFVNTTPGGAADDVTIVLPSHNWGRVGSGWQYFPMEANDPIRTVKWTPGRLIIRAGGPAWPYTLDEVSQGSIGVQFLFGLNTAYHRLCAEAPARTDRENRFDGVPRTPEPETCAP